MQSITYPNSEAFDAVRVEFSDMLNGIKRFRVYNRDWWYREGEERGSLTNEIGYGYIVSGEVRAYLNIKLVIRTSEIVIDYRGGNLDKAMTYVTKLAHLVETTDLN